MKRIVIALLLGASFIMTVKANEPKITYIVDNQPIAKGGKFYTQETPKPTVPPIKQEKVSTWKDWCEPVDDRELYKITAYCPCEQCSAQYGRQTSTGKIAKQGRTIAVDPDIIPYGTKVTIEGIGTFEAEDCGVGVKGNHIDVYFEKHEDVERFGKKIKKIYTER